MSGKVCGKLAERFGGWSVPVWTVAATALGGTLFFLALWRTRADSY